MGPVRKAELLCGMFVVGSLMILLIGAFAYDMGFLK